MEIGKRYSIDFPQNTGKRKNLNEFTPVKGKTAGHEAIKEFLKQKDVAAWFRGTSHIHLCGADKLFNALRDDGEQKTTHRVRTCLHLIGVKPMITSQQIKFLMLLSRGNDLVFLWFLMEMHYKTPKHDPKSYSLNEQLICSAICHLDMITTLRELDKILPCGHTSGIEMKKAELKRPERKESFEKRSREGTSNEFVLPYFMKYCRPQPYGKSLYLKEPNFIVDYKFYNRYQNPNYNVQNESNRWYADYNFNPGTRVVHSIIRETIKNIFYTFETVSLRLKTTDVLCDYHKTLKMIAVNRKHELIVEARDKCLRRFLQSTKEIKNKKIKTTIDLLENAVQEQLCKFKAETKSLHKNESLKVISTDCQIFDVCLGSNNIDCLDNKDIKSVNDPIKLEAVVQENFAFHESIEGDIRQKHENESRQKVNYANKDTCQVRMQMRPSADVLFQAPTKNKPFVFNYRKIFAPSCKDNAKKCIQRMILKALSQDTIDGSSSTEFKKSSRLIYDKAVKKYTKKTFENEVKKYENEKLSDEMENNHKAECLRPIVQYPAVSANYNAENYGLMEQMLFDAFEYLRKNPKFVWAQLPDAHRVPLLREWIARRFGKGYTYTERVKSYRRSCIIFRALDKSKIQLTVPNANQIGNNLFLSYNCRNYVDKKVERIKSRFYHRLDSKFFEHTRTFWFAMRGYICSKGPPRKSFFAYMPSRLQDVQHFRLWKSSEYRNRQIATKSNQLF